MAETKVALSVQKAQIAADQKATLEKYKTMWDELADICNEHPMLLEKGAKIEGYADRVRVLLWAAPEGHAQILQLRRCLGRKIKPV